MSFQGMLKDNSFGVQLLFLIIFILGGAIFTSVLFSGFVLVKSGFSLESIMDVSANITEYPDMCRGMLFFQSLGMFLVPTLVAGSLFSTDMREYLKTETPLSSTLILLTILSMIVIIPFLNLTVFLNQQMTFPDSLKWLGTWMSDKENEAKMITDSILYTNDIGALLMNLLVVAVLAGVSEEFLFRGALQQIFSKLFKNQFVIIWVVAILFSAIHLQFYGFIPRMLMGAYFGYLLYYTKSIWIPVIAHFTNNAIGVLSCYFIKDTGTLKQLEELGTSQSTYFVAGISLLLWSFIFLLIKRNSKAMIE